MDRWRIGTAGAPLVVECTVNYEVQCFSHTNLCFKPVTIRDKNTFVFLRSVSKSTFLGEWKNLVLALLALDVIFWTTPRTFQLPKRVHDFHPP